jgi:alkanesulfonate monooxygenase SsuD/methylene tetrahydromethanopterin reductase-like flavin-dependent oxidoreductase (luciferase family)
MRFCAYQYQRLGLPELVRRWRLAEELGFDVLWNVDTVVDPDGERSPMLDGPSILSAMALRTSTIRIGTLVTSLYFRHPVLAARASVTVDHLSDGRVEVALGVGDPAAGPAAVGADSLTPAEHVDRFAEFAELVDLLLRQEVTTYEGKHFTCRNAEVIPGPVQRPRPPITIAAHGPRMLLIAARYADGWSSWGGYGIETEAQMLAVTRERSHRFEELCVELGRDPASVRRSLVCFPPLTPWESPEYFRDMVGRYGEIGIDELVLYFPEEWREAPHEWRTMDAVARDVFPELRDR